MVYRALVQGNELDIEQRLRNQRPPKQLPTRPSQIDTHHLHLWRWKILFPIALLRAERGDAKPEAVKCLSGQAGTALPLSV